MKFLPNNTFALNLENSLSTHKFFEVTPRIELSTETRRNFESREATRRIMVEESITSRQSVVLQPQFSPIRGFGGLLKKLSARVQRQSSQSVRSAASNRSDKSEAESHLRASRVRVL